ncbi:MAG: S1 family peptidase, partial [Nannocystaceae bacterium]
MKSRNLCYVGAATAALITVLCPQQALAQAGQSAAFSAKPEPETPLPIYGGEPTATCGWPTTVSMQGSCTGTLVHPRVVVYAAHCGADYPEIWFGEDIDAPTRVVPTSLCQTHPPPTLGAGQDIAFCVLAEPVEDIPIIPILMGCELDALVPGRKTALVGYGFTEDDVYGIKHEVTTIVEGFADNEILLGGDGNDACNGDSGGPGYFRLDPDTFPGGDGSWRVFGITSYGKSCGGSTYYSMIHTNIDWLEETAGIDVTPCHDRDGTWNPSALCGQVPLAPQDSVGTWNAGCGGGPVSDWLASCGEPFDGSDDMVPPITTVTAPGDGSVFEVDTPNATIYVRVDSEDPGGWGLKEHTLLIDGQELAVHSSQSPL